MEGFMTWFFREAAQEIGQKVTYCGVGAHHQNGVIERFNKEVTIQARTLLLHAQRMWPEMINNMLWPLALLAAGDKHNRLSFSAEGFTPEQRAAEVSRLTDVEIFHT